MDDASCSRPRAHIAALLLEVERAQARCRFWRTRPDGAAPLIGSSRAIKTLRERIERVAATDFTVLIEGESGSGKELVARQIHDLSRRRRGPFVAVNCAAIVETLLEAELFGIEDRTATGVRGRRGKFEHAHDGTLFLDEVSDLSPAAQAKLLRAIQDLSIERVGGCGGAARRHAGDRGDEPATGGTGRARSLPDGSLLSPQRHRRAGSAAPSPPRRHPGARPCTSSIVTAIVRPLQLSQAASDALLAYDWPGNVRELERVMERAVALAGSPSLELDDLPPGCWEHTRKYCCPPFARGMACAHGPVVMHVWCSNAAGTTNDEHAGNWGFPITRCRRIFDIRAGMRASVLACIDHSEWRIRPLGGGWCREPPVHVSGEAGRQGCRQGRVAGSDRLPSNEEGLRRRILWRGITSPVRVAPCLWCSMVILLLPPAAYAQEVDEDYILYHLGPAAEEMQWAGVDGSGDSSPAIIEIAQRWVIEPAFWVSPDEARMLARSEREDGEVRGRLGSLRDPQQSYPFALTLARFGVVTVALTCGQAQEKARSAQRLADTLSRVSQLNGVGTGYGGRAQSGCNTFRGSYGVCNDGYGICVSVGGTIGFGLPKRSVFGRRSSMAVSTERSEDNNAFRQTPSPAGLLHLGDVGGGLRPCILDLLSDCGAARVSRTVTRLLEPRARRSADHRSPQQRADGKRRCRNPDTARVRPSDAGCAEIAGVPRVGRRRSPGTVSDHIGRL